MKRPAPKWFCAGALFAVTLAAPLVGAVGALFWTRQDNLSDAFADDTLAARRVVQGVSEGWGIPDFAGWPAYRLKVWTRPDTGDKRDCDNILRAKYLAGTDQAARTFQRIYGAMLHEEQRLGKMDADLIAEGAFRGLPTPVLGALAQCIEHSLLSGACTIWARHHLAGDGAVRARIDAQLLIHARSGDDQACLLLDWVKPSSAGQTLIGTLK
ncbi:hypothetical protein [Novosphingobium sediminicola]|uniref:Uncharacterized protein n=1 Tax=Novosphingobium sediminicola TaxID=563162 RepID=A0A7W6CFE9_9SPHN|nr:hypothetical protein [Novosphingobium sediminicola]MBB3954842.1 hypothetical protein [Novosphingobium sediminicola]